MTSLTLRRSTRHPLCPSNQLNQAPALSWKVAADWTRHTKFGLAVQKRRHATIATEKYH